MKITIGELYNSESSKRKKLRRKHRLYRFFGYNPTMLAFKRKCAFCLTDLTDESVEGVCEQSSLFDYQEFIYIEEHKCPGCKQNWSYHRGYERGTYKFDERDRKEMETFAPFREENKRRIEVLLGLQKEENENHK